MLISDSTSAIQSSLSRNAGIHHPYRARLLAQLSEQLVTLTNEVYTGWIRSKFNPADAASRFWKFTNTPLVYNTHLPVDLQNCVFSIN